MKKLSRSWIRFIILFLIIVFGVTLIYLFYKYKIRTQYKSSFTQAFSLLGLTTKTVDRAFSRIIPIDSLDEKELGEAIAARYENSINKDDKDYIYLNQIMKNLQPHTKKPFQYKIYPVDYNIPNAFALPGGIIVITKSLLEVVESESELTAIIAHEIGHIERSHCFDMVKFELLSRKLGDKTLGETTDLVVYLLVQKSFSKTMENEADEYGYGLLLKTNYDPSAMAMSFENLRKYYEKEFSYNEMEREADIIRDYFESHPLIKLRVEKYTEKAKLYWKLNKKKLKYVGKKNIDERICYYDKDYGISEWIRREF